MALGMEVRRTGQRYHVSMKMKARIRPEDSAFQRCNDYVIYYGLGEYTKKNSRGSPCFSYLKFLKQSFWVI
jgi:hypothetical protein